MRGGGLIGRIVVAIAAFAVASGTPRAEPAWAHQSETAAVSSCERVNGDRPNRAMIVAVVRAGGGRDGFRATALIETLAGTRAHAELTELTRRHGAPAIRSFITAFDGVVTNTARRVAVDDRAVDADLSTQAADGDGLLRELLACGTPRMQSGTATTFDARTMFERIFSSVAYADAGHAVDAAYGQHTTRDFERMFTEFMRGLATI